MQLFKLIKAWIYNFNSTMSTNIEPNTNNIKSTKRKVA